MQKVDGRRARGLRTRTAIIDALLELVSEGEIKPTAQRIADRAGVSVRSVYQHFSHVEGLFKEAAERAQEIADEMAIDIDPDLGFEDRLDYYVAARSGLLEELLPFSKAARLVETESEILAKYRGSLEKQARDETAKVFAPELAEVGGAQRRQALAALDLLTTWSGWEHLRDNGTSARAARQVMRTGVEAILEGLDAVAS